MLLACAAALFIASYAASCAAPPRPTLVPDGYRSWSLTTNVRLDYPIPGHEDRYRVIQMNEKGFTFTRAEGPSGRVDFPEGTIIAKDIFPTSNPGPTDLPVMLTAMIKAPSDPDARGGWLWVIKDLSSGMETLQKGDFCVRCHANANEAHPYGSKNPGGAFSDYVFFVPGRQSAASSTGAY
jgi:hypothetical protein